MSEPTQLADVLTAGVDVTPGQSDLVSDGAQAITDLGPDGAACTVLQIPYEEWRIQTRTPGKFRFSHYVKGELRAHFQDTDKEAAIDWMASLIRRGY